MVLTSGPRGADRRDTWHTDGYLLLRGVVAPDRCAALLAGPAPGDDGPGAGVDELVANVLATLPGSGAGPAVSRLVVRRTGQPGTPWGRAADHRAVRRGQPAAAWLAVTDAGLDNGCPWLLPGSHAGARADPELAPASGRRSLAGNDDGDGTPAPILGIDAGAAVPVALEPGDVLVVDGHLVHRWTDNHSTVPVAAVEWHLAG